ncbi:MAG: hypothetical protein JWN40_5383 [Phycisphaerales bacterium]|nr:hypothetical protein [Phycisphaerales bacterium]
MGKIKFFRSLAKIRKLNRRARYRANEKRDTTLKRRVPRVISCELSLSEEREDALGGGIGGGEDGRAGLRKNLGTSEGRGLGGEVRIADR